MTIETFNTTQVMAQSLVPNFEASIRDLLKERFVSVECIQFLIFDRLKFKALLMLQWCGGTQCRTISNVSDILAG
jgi:hypothetical protein